VNLTETLTAIRTATDAMKSEAEQGEWASVAEQEQSRLALIQSVFSTPVSQEDSDRVREAINYILEIDKEILSKAQAAKTQIHSQAKQLLIEKAAFEEYAKN
jgi:hypothetical protein